jgi:hypothetical protein
MDRNGGRSAEKSITKHFIVNWTSATKFAAVLLVMAVQFSGVKKTTSIHLAERVLYYQNMNQRTPIPQGSARTLARFDALVRKVPFVPRPHYSCQHRANVRIGT